MKLGLTRTGAGPPLVLLHALGAHRGIWNPVIAPLASEREVFAFDLPGFGDSDCYLEGRASPDRIARTVAGEMERLGVDEYAVAGNSFGGWAALEMGLQGAVTSVTAIAPAGLWRGPLVPKPLIGQFFARLAYPLLPMLVRAGGLRRALLMTQMAHPGNVPRADALTLLQKYARAKGLKSAQNAMRAGSFKQLGDIEVPVLLVWPQRDRLIARPRKIPPQIENVTLADCGHLPQWDDPEAVAGALIAGSSTGLRQAV